MTWLRRGWRGIGARPCAGFVVLVISACLVPLPTLAAQQLELPPLRMPDEVNLPPAPSPPINLPAGRGQCAQTPTAITMPQPAPAAQDEKAMPINLDAVLRLAQDQNGQVRLARERLYEAQIEQELAAKRWLPEISVGAGWWRHEGGIQDFQGNLVHSSYGGVNPGMEWRGKLDIRDAVFARIDASRKVWQQQGELSKFTADQLLDAATTYVELMAAKAAERIAVEAEAKLQRLLEQAKGLEKVDPGVRVEVARVESELGAQRV